MKDKDYNGNYAREILKNIFGTKCKKCKKETDPIIFHHIDGDSNNNQIDNIMPLCASCHGKAHKKKAKKYGKHPSKMKYPLSIEERKLALDTAKKMKAIDGIPPYKVIATFMFTGMHPSVLADRGKSRVRVVDSYVEWIRPKKKGSEGYTKVLIHKEIAPWIEDFLLSDLPAWREWYWYLCKEVGENAGFDITPMTLRHTFGVMLDELGFTPAEIQSLMNCSLGVLMRYTTRTQKQIEGKLRDQGWA